MIFATHIHWRIAASYAVLIGVVFGALGVYLVSYLRAHGYETLEADLRRQAALVADLAQLQRASQGSESLNALARRLGAETGARITLIDRDGRVLADSEGDPALMDDHSTRPEVAQALRGVPGGSQRYSATVDRDLLYVAVPVGSGGLVEGVARVALPIRDTERSVNSVVLAVVAALAAASTLSVAVAVLLARVITRPIVELTTAARGLAAGDLDRAIAVRGRDEVSRLGHAFADMAAAVRAHVRALEDQRGRLAVVLREMADGVIMTDLQGIVSLVNPAAGRLLGVSPEAAEGRSLAEALRDHELALLVRGALRGSGAGSRVVEVGSHSTRRVVQAIAARIPEGDGGESGVLLILQDVTELRRADMVRREFVANVSHELRTPVAAIKALVETLEAGAIRDPPAADDFLTRVHVEVDGLAQLVEELLELSRIESGQKVMDLRPVDLVEAARAAVDRLRPQAQRQGVQLQSHMPEAVPPVPADADRIQQVVLNLVHNAIKFTPPGGQITVSARLDRDEAVLSVADTGVGISTDALPRLFERFYKGDPSRAGAGTGLGLAIAKHIVEAHHGRIWAESEGEGRGATVSFALPI